MKDYIEPVSFQVPRKSDMFQEDLYPDTYAGIPALTSEEWFGGEDKNAPTVSMKPGDKKDGGDKPSVKLTAKPSSSDLERQLNETKQELEVAKKRIQELEAELAKLKH